MSHPKGSEGASDYVSGEVHLLETAIYRVAAALSLVSSGLHSSINTTAHTTTTLQPVTV